jgi:cytoskeletal protein RodZ
MAADRRDWASRWSKRKPTYSWKFWLLVVAVALLLALPIWFYVFPRIV